MKFVILQIIIVVAMVAIESTLAQRNLQGYELLGPAPTLGRTATKFYYLNNYLVDWNTAFTSCIQQGGQLVTPSNYLQDTALKEYMEQVGGFSWAGGKATDVNWHWLTTNQPFTYHNFSSEYSRCETAGSCLLVGFAKDPLEWVWCGANCTQLSKFICEF